MRALVVSAPASDASTNWIVTSASDAAAGRLRASGHAVTVLDLASFDPVLGRAEREAYVTDRPIISEVVAEHAEAVLSCSVLVVVYATTLSTLPPVLKGWLERVLVPGVSFHLDEAGRVHRGLLGLDVLIGIAVYDETWLSTKRTFDGGRRILMRCLRLCGRLTLRTSWLALYSADRADEVRVSQFLGRIERRMAKL